MRESTTFDPFLSVKLPLASSAEERMQVMTVSMVRSSDPSEVSTHQAPVSKEGNVADLVAAVSAEAPLDVKGWLLAEMRNKEIYKISQDNEAIAGIRGDDVLLPYELADPEGFKTDSDGYSYDSSATAGKCGFGVYHRQARPDSTYRSKELVGVPGFMFLDRELSVAGLGDAVQLYLDHSGMNMSSGDTEEKPWRLYLVKDKWDVNPYGSPLDDPHKELGLGSREYLAVEWSDQVEFPAKFAQAADAVTNTSAFDGGQSGEPELELEKCFQMFTEQEQLGRRARSAALTATSTSERWRTWSA